ncbi:MAG TPA: hypothetical protein VFV50_04305, partial [Bdellovibrionales bacterium]|nr:hypothetical protein [Bdellovibrionales bacterium]
MKLSIIILTILTAGSANAAALLECKSAAPAGPVEVKLFAQVPGGWHPVTVNTQSGYLNYAAVITGAADDFFGAKKQFK